MTTLEPGGKLLPYGLQWAEHSGFTRIINQVSGDVFDHLGIPGNDVNMETLSASATDGYSTKRPVMQSFGLFVVMLNNIQHIWKQDADITLVCDTLKLVRIG